MGMPSKYMVAVGNDEKAFYAGEAGAGYPVYKEHRLLRLRQLAKA